MRQPRVWCLSHTQKSALSTVRCLTTSAALVKSRSEDDKGCCGNWEMSQSHTALQPMSTEQLANQTPLN